MQITRILTVFFLRAFFGTFLGTLIGFTQISQVHAAQTQTSEPTYCDPTAFDEKELNLGEGLELEKKGLNRIHAFKVGKVTLVGVGVGNSKAEALKEMQKKHSSTSSNGASDRFCTFYLNHPKSDKDVTARQASETFVQKDIPKSPQKMTEKEAAKDFMEVLKGTFDQEPINFLSCAAQENYIALGCNNMMHRGPTVFGMVLAFSGCTPEHSMEIANQTWGLNHVKRKIRLAAIREAYELGNTRKESRKKLADLLSAQSVAHE